MILSLDHFTTGVNFFFFYQKTPKLGNALVALCRRPGHGVPEQGFAGRGLVAAEAKPHPGPCPLLQDPPARG